MKLLLIIFLSGISIICPAQDLLGKWQLVRQSTCVEDDLDPVSKEEEEIISEMKSMSGALPQVIQFRENNKAEESTKIFNRRRSYNSNALLYKHTPSALHILDKKSRMIIESFTIEKLTADSLIISDAARACETKVFVKINTARE
jgi:hypothetical protein